MIDFPSKLNASNFHGHCINVYFCQHRRSHEQLLYKYFNFIISCVRVLCVSILILIESKKAFYVDYVHKYTSD